MSGEMIIRRELLKLLLVPLVHAMSASGQPPAQQQRERVIEVFGGHIIMRWEWIEPA